MNKGGIPKRGTKGGLTEGVTKLGGLTTKALTKRGTKGGIPRGAQGGLPRGAQRGAYQEGHKRGILRRAQK